MWSKLCLVWKVVFCKHHLHIDICLSMHEHVQGISAQVSSFSVSRFKSLVVRTECVEKSSSDQIVPFIKEMYEI